MGITDEKQTLVQCVREHGATEQVVERITELACDYSVMMNLLDFLEKNPEATVQRILEQASCFKRLEQFTLCLQEYPPDLKKAKAILEEGVDLHYINHVNETLLCELITGYPIQKVMNPCMVCDQYDGCETHSCEKTDKVFDSRYLPDIIRFCLENGYDVSRENGRFGAEALSALCWSTGDKVILDAAKILLDAGADPFCSDSEGEDVFASISWVLAGCIPVDEDLEAECLFSAFYDLAESKTKGLDYRKIQWWDAVRGKRIDRVLSCGACGEEVTYAFSTGDHRYKNCFGDEIVLDCEGTMLMITKYCHAYVNPLKLPDHPVDLLDRLHGIVGKRVADVRFSVNMGEQGRMRSHGSVLEICMDDGTVLTVRDNGDQFGEEYCAWFEVSCR